jgi:hypothetical protein
VGDSLIAHAECAREAKQTLIANPQSVLPVTRVMIAIALAAEPSPRSSS